MRKLFLTWLAGLLILVSALVGTAEALDVSGKVFEDANANGVFDPHEVPLAGVVVSDGKTVTLTGRDGIYSLQTEPARLVFVSVPGTHHAAENKFYRRIERPAAVNFPLLRNRNEGRDKFTFVFVSDTHVGFIRQAREGTAKAYNAVMALEPDVVIHGGDVILDGLNVDEDLARKQFEQYVNELEPLIKAPFYHTIGNHDVFGWYSLPDPKKAPSLYGKKMYEKFFGPRYYSFNYAHCHFVVLDSIGREKVSTGEPTYCGFVDADQLDWLRKDLKHVEKARPIVLVTHIPTINALASMFGTKGEMVTTASGETVPKHQISNFPELFEVMKDSNFRLGLAGHFHTFEEIHWKNNLQDALLVVGGSVCGEWWKGDRAVGPVSWPEGFTLIKVEGEQFDVSYIPYGWKGENEN